MRPIIQGKKVVIFYLIIGACTALATPELLYAGTPPVDPTTGDPPFGPPEGNPPYGKGKGKGSAVARVTFHCYGYSYQAVKQNADFSTLAQTYVADIGATFSGTSTADLVNEKNQPTILTKAGISADGLSLQTYDTCGTSSEGVLKLVISGVNKEDTSAFGSTIVTPFIHIAANVFTDSNDNSALQYKASHKIGAGNSSVEINVDGDGVSDAPGLTITPEPDGSLSIATIVQLAPLTLNFGPGIENNIAISSSSSAVIELVSKGGGIAAGSAKIDVQAQLFDLSSDDTRIEFSVVNPALDSATETDNTSG